MIAAINSICYSP